MENCSCKDDPQKDGCYHCLYAYRQSQQIGNISRTTAIRILKSILSGKDNVQKIDKINDIPVNPLFDSELEQRFMEAIRTKVGAANVSDTIRNGKHSYYVKIENFAWEIEPQVLLDAGSGVSVDCKPDFVFPHQSTSLWLYSQMVSYITKTSFLMIQLSEKLFAEAAISVFGR